MAEPERVMVDLTEQFNSIKKFRPDWTAGIFREYSKKWINEKIKRETK